MSDLCRELGPVRDAFSDGTISAEDAERLRLHMDGCADCRRDVRERAALRRLLAKASLPTPPSELRARITGALDRADHPLGRTILRWSPVAAAGLAAALLLMFVLPAQADVPRLVRQSSDVHDGLLSGAVRPLALTDPAALRDYFRRTLGADVYAPALGCDVDGGCVCTLPDDKLQAPLIIYRRGDVLISLLVVPDDGRSMPASARRTQGAIDYYVFRRGANTVICCRSGQTCHVWIARLPERELLETVLSTREGRQAFSGVRLSLRGVT